MLAGKTREELEEKLIEPVISIKRKRKIQQQIKENLLNNNKILEGNVQSLLNDPANELSKIDWRMLLLFAEQIYLATSDESINPKRFYTDVEIRKARQFNGKLTVEEDLSLPLTLENVIMIDYDKYVTTIPVKTLAQMSALLLNYNFDIQRESKKKVIGGETIEVATLVMKNVLEIKEHLKKGTLETTSIVINASAGTSSVGDELYYDSQTMTLTINEGTVLDIVDGYHRCKASELAINESPDIDFKFIVLILNYTDDQAAKYQGQLAKATPISKTRQRQLSEERYADKIVKRLDSQSSLRGKISDSSRPSARNKELVSYNVLADTIDEEFELERVVEVHKVGKYLIQFFDILLDHYQEQFIENLSKTKKESLLVENNMFAGYVVLAKRLYYAGLEPIEAISVLEQIDFRKDNSIWQELKILDKEQKLTNVARKEIKNYFHSISISS